MSFDSPSSRAGEAHGLRGIGEGLFTPNLAPRTRGKQVRSELDLLAREKRLTTAPEQRDGPLQVLMQNQKRSGRESEQGGKPVRVEPSPHRARYTKDLTVKTQTPGVTTEKGQIALNQREPQENLPSTSWLNILGMGTSLIGPTLQTSLTF